MQAPERITEYQSKLPTTKVSYRRLDGMAVEAAQPPNDDLECQLCEEVMKAAKGKAVEECDKLCKEAGSLAAICDQACTMLKDKVDPETVCKKVKLCPTNSSIVV